MPNLDNSKLLNLIISLDKDQFNYLTYKQTIVKSLHSLRILQLKLDTVTTCGHGLEYSFNTKKSPKLNIHFGLVTS